jgi:hypothetical protein
MIKKWNKQEFLEAVKPCGYKWRIWWWFKRHEYVTLLDVCKARLINIGTKLYVMGELDITLWERGDWNDGKVSNEEIIETIRAELEAS